MTSFKRRWYVKAQSMLRACQQPFEAIAKAAGRIFSPSDDDYPQTGTQPFKGDIPDAHSQYHAPW